MTTMLNPLQNEPDELKRILASYPPPLLATWLRNAEAKYLKLKERKTRPKKPNVNKLLSTFDAADMEAIKKKLAQ